MSAMSHLSGLTTVLLLLALGQDDFRDFRDTFRNSFREEGTPEDRLATAEAVATFGTRDSTELLVTGIGIEQGIIDGLMEEREAIRTGKDKSLKGRDPEPYLVAIKKRLDVEYRVMETIEKAFGKLADADAVEYLARTVLQRDKCWKARDMAARALAKIGDRQQLKWMAKGLSDKDVRVRTAVLLALGDMRAEEVLEDVSKCLADKDWLIRSGAIDALGRIRDFRSVDPLIERMRLEEGRLAEDCAKALEKITGQRFGRAPDVWAKWWGENRERALAGERLDLPPEPEKKPEDEDGYYHGIPVVSRRTIFILDISQSMTYSNVEFQELPKEGEQSRVDLAKKELARALKNYDPKGTLGLIAFHSVVLVWRPRLVPATPQMKDDATEWATALEPTGTTNIYGALEAAFRMAGFGVSDKYYEPSADTIFLLSDGAPTNEDLTDDDPERIFRAVREWNRLGRVEIHTVGMKGHSATFMSRLAKENGGTYASRE